MIAWRETKFFPRDLCYGEMWRLNAEEGWTFGPLMNHHGDYSMLAWRRGDAILAICTERCDEDAED